MYSISGSGVTGYRHRKTIAVSDLRYTHDEISSKFQLSTDRGQWVSPSGDSLEDSFHRLVKKPGDIAKVPLMKVMRHKDEYWVINGNRRLFVYKMLQRAGLIQNVSVTVVPYERDRFDSAFTTKCSGARVTVRGVGAMWEYEQKFRANASPEARHIVQDTRRAASSQNSWEYSTYAPAPRYNRPVPESSNNTESWWPVIAVCVIVGVVCISMLFKQP